MLPEGPFRFVRCGHHVCRLYADGTVRRQCQYPTKRQADAHVRRGNSQ